MAFNFPNAPTVNQVFTPVSGVSYVWTGTQWDRLATAAMTIPPGVYVPYAGPTEPLGWLFCDGKAISRAAYPLLFTAIGTSHGAGDGTTTFNVPDMRGRAAFGRDDMGGTAAGRLTNVGVGNSGINGTLLGANGGVDRRTLTITELPTHSHTGSGTSELNNVGHTHTGLSGLENQNHRHYASGVTDAQGTHHHNTSGFVTAGSAGSSNYTASGLVQNRLPRDTEDAGSHAHNINFWTGYVEANHNHYFTTDGQSANHTHAFGFTTVNAGDQQAFPIMPPALVANYIIFAGA
jgi:microcystin-dependent protein